MKSKTAKLVQLRSVAFLSVPKKTEKASISKQDAEVLLNAINYLNSKIFQNIVMFVHHKAHIALGFNKPSKALNNAHSLSRSYVSKLLKSANIYLSVDPELTHLKLVSENTFRCCNHLSDKECINVWTQVINTLSDKDKRITEKMMLHAMNKLNLLPILNNPAKVFLDKQRTEKAKMLACEIGKKFVAKNASNQEEWNQLCKLIYQQLLISRDLVQPAYTSK